MNVQKFIFKETYQDRDLKYILYCIYWCYLKIIESESIVINKENDIRDLFISDEYLDNHSIKEDLGICQYMFDKEIQTLDGRVDIRVVDMIQKIKGIYKPYYYIECKRIDDVTPNYSNSLNNKYINEGINRFVNEKYPTYLEANGMLGFVVKSIDIMENTKRITGLEPYIFIDNFSYTYKSNHSTTSNKTITLYHLMLDFSSKINSLNKSEEVS
ncbi:MAG: hypothetical protein VB066_02350 [Paludibacter sp.]|nr:hypothetical protein [Paludibacter sp.]